MAHIRGYVRNGTDNFTFLDVLFVPGTQESAIPFILARGLRCKFPDKRAVPFFILGLIALLSWSVLDLWFRWDTRF
jgi:hypothetical protein